VAFVATLFFVSGLVFVVVRVLPGDPALVIIGPEGSPEAAARLRWTISKTRRATLRVRSRTRSAPTRVATRRIVRVRTRTPSASSELSVG